MTKSWQKPDQASVQPQSAALSDWDLVCRVRNGDSAAFELIMRRNNSRVYRLARSILKNAAEAEDAAQDAYLRAFEKLDSFRGPDGFASWLGRIVLNEALGRLRKSSRIVSIEDHRHDSAMDARVKLADSFMSQKQNPEYLAANSQLRGLLEQAIDELPQPFRTVFILRAVEGLSVAETAELLSIPPDTVKTRFHRARKRLRKSVGATLDELMPGVHPFAGERCDRLVAAVLKRAFADPGPNHQGG